MRRCWLFAVLFAFFSFTASATTLAYDVTFVSSMNYPNWHGTFTVDSAFGSLLSANFAIVNQTYTAVDATDMFDGTNLTYYDQIFFFSPVPNVNLYYTLNMSGGAYSFGVNSPIDMGTYSVALQQATPAATPEPGSLALLGTGVLGVWGASRRRRIPS